MVRSQLALEQRPNPCHDDEHRPEAGARAATPKSGRPSFMGTFVTSRDVCAHAGHMSVR